MTRADLIAALEKAEGPSVGLDMAIGMAIGFPSGVPLYTASIDAALTLVPAGMQWTISRRDTPYGKDTAEAHIHNGKLHMSGQYRGFDVWGHTPALALCIAALRARSDAA